jgi:hypothetical protein
MNQTLVGPEVVPVLPNKGRPRSRRIVAVPRWTTPSSMWTTWKAVIGSTTWRVRRGGRGIGCPFQSGALQPSQGRVSARQITWPFRSWR